MSLAKLISVWSAGGAVGKTTLAIAFAAELADSGKKVFLVDGDTYNPSVDLNLGIQDHPAGLAAACRLVSQDRFNLDELNRLSVALKCGSGGLTVMTGLSNSNRWPEVGSERLDEMITKASDYFDFIILDLASPIETGISGAHAVGERNAVTRWAISYSDTVVSICGSDPVSISRYLSQLPEISELSPQGQMLTLINRLRNSVLGMSAKQQIKETLDRLGQVEIAGFIPDDPAAADAALRDSLPINLGRRSAQSRSAISLFVKNQLLGNRNQLDRRMAKLV